MGRFREKLSEDDSDAGIDMSPLIDCVFILLIFFIVTTTFVEETGVEVDKPQAASATQLQKTSILIALTENGEVHYGGKEIGIGAVRPLIKRMLAGDPSVPIIIQADRLSEFGLLVRVIDEIKLAKPDDPPKVSVATAASKG